MAKCEKCNAEYADGTEHVCPSEEKQEAPAGEKSAPAEPAQ